MGYEQRRAEMGKGQEDTVVAMRQAERRQCDENFPDEMPHNMTSARNPAHLPQNYKTPDMRGVVGFLAKSTRRPGRVAGLCGARTRASKGKKLCCWRVLISWNCTIINKKNI